jgi:hypothetical protein
MAWSDFLLAPSRRAMIVIGTALALCVSSSSGIRAAGQEQKDDLKLNLDGPAIVLFKIKADRVADFEALIAAIRAGLAKSEKDDVKAFGAAYQPLKVETVPGLFVFNLATPSKTISYNPVALLFFVDPVAIKREEADVLYKKWEGAAESINIWPLKQIGG